MKNFSFGSEKMQEICVNSLLSCKASGLEERLSFNFFSNCEANFQQMMKKKRTNLFPLGFADVSQILNKMRSNVVEENKCFRYSKYFFKGIRNISVEDFQMIRCLSIGFIFYFLT